jgi:hypothetical protein
MQWKRRCELRQDQRTARLSESQGSLFCIIPEQIGVSQDLSSTCSPLDDERIALFSGREGLMFILVEARVGRPLWFQRRLARGVATKRAMP